MCQNNVKLKIFIYILDKLCQLESDHENRVHYRKGITLLYLRYMKRKEIE